MAAAQREAFRVLILGGTAEAAALAKRLSDASGLEVMTSLAGRTRKPAAIPGQARAGGFGGAAGLAAFLRDQRIGMLVDATHPFAALMPHNAAAACSAESVPRLMLKRPEWQPRSDDCWTRVENAEAAAGALPTLGRRAFLTIGRQEIGAFAGARDIRFLVRLIDPPADPLPLRNFELVLGRGPFSLEDEVGLLDRHRIDVVVSKNSGGEATYAKLAAARLRGVPVVMIARPRLPDGETVERVEDAVAWIKARSRAP